MFRVSSPRTVSALEVVCGILLLAVIVALLGARAIAGVGVMLTRWLLIVSFLVAIIFALF